MFLRPFTLALMLAASAALVGCQSTGTTALSSDTKAVYCPKCQTTWVMTPQSKPGVLRPEKTEVCPDCDKMAASYFKTGNMPHTCKTCGATMVHCEVH